MKLKMFTVYDSAAKAYLVPFYLQGTGQAIRAFEDTANDPNHAFNKHPADYTLFEMGTFDDNMGIIEQHSTAVPLGKAIDFITQSTTGAKLQ